MRGPGGCRSCHNDRTRGGRPIFDARAIAEVFAGFRDGRDDAVETVARWVASVLRGGNWRFADPEGVSQEVQLRLVRISRSGKVRDPESFQKLVYTVAKNTCVDVYHRDRRRDSREDDDAEADALPSSARDAESRLEERERLDRIAYVFQRLPEACRDLLDRIYRHGLSAAAVGEKLGITANNVRVRAHRCLEKARSIHREHEPRVGVAEAAHRVG